MNCYKLAVTGSNGVQNTRYASSQSDVRSKRAELVKSTECKKVDVIVTQVDVPTSKSGILKFLNTLCEKVDVKIG